MKSTASLPVSPFEGEGHAVVEGQGSTSGNSIPRQHPPAVGLNMSTFSPDQPLTVFVASDQPALEAFDLFRKWGRSALGEVTRIVG